MDFDPSPKVRALQERLGAFMTGRGFYANVAVSMGVFWVVCALASPLAAIPSVGLWVVK